MAISLEIFSPYVVPFVVGCPDSTIRMNLLEAAIELCERSGVWTANVPLAAMDGGLFAPVLPAGARVLLVKEVWRSAASTLPESAYDVAGDWGTLSFREPQLAAQAAGFTATVCMVPTRITAGQPTSELPDFLVERFLNGIAAGAKSRLMCMPGQSWTNPVLGLTFQQEFNRACGTAAIETQHGRAANSPRVQYRRFQ